ncbi:hypothetical protein M2369_001359 [Bacillus sp. JUb11]|nr:hypothetical protein [Bacillus sp. JUb11]
MMLILTALLWVMSLVLFLTYPENEKQDGEVFHDEITFLNKYIKRLRRDPKP